MDDRKQAKRLGGMAEALSIASDLGFPIQQEPQSLNNSSSNGDKSDELIRILRELTLVQRSIASPQVELQGRKALESFYDKFDSDFIDIKQKLVRCFREKMT